jgi:hypothetical protein
MGTWGLLSLNQWCDGSTAPFHPSHPSHPSHPTIAHITGMHTGTHTYIHSTRCTCTQIHTYREASMHTYATHAHAWMHACTHDNIHPVGSLN